MRFIVVVISILCSVQLSAQVEYSFPGDKPINAEMPRGEVLPYNRVRVVAGDADKYAYITMPTNWGCTKDEGKTIFTSTFAMPLSWLNRQTILRIGYSSSAFDVEVNGKTVGYAPGGATAVEFNITKYVSTDGNSLSIIQHDDAAVNAILPGGKRGVSDIKIISQPTIRVRDMVYATTLNDEGDGVAEIGVVVKCDALNAKQSELGYTLLLHDTVVVAKGSRTVKLDMRGEDTVRFVARIPKESLWSAANPEMLRLDVTNKIDGRIAECVGRDVGFRSIDVRGNAFYINGKLTRLNIVDYQPGLSVEDLASSGYNGVAVTNGAVPQSFIDECDRNGVYVMAVSAIDTSSAGTTIRRGGNPSNNPIWRDTYILRNENNYHTMKSHASVVGYIIGRGNTTGINVYESYLGMKSLEHRLPVLYEGANGEWCTDNVKIR